MSRGRRRLAVRLRGGVVPIKGCGLSVDPGRGGSRRGGNERGLQASGR